MPATLSAPISDFDASPRGAVAATSAPFGEVDVDPQAAGSSLGEEASAASPDASVPPPAPLPSEPEATLPVEPTAPAAVPEPVASPPVVDPLTAESAAAINPDPDDDDDDEVFAESTSQLTVGSSLLASEEPVQPQVVSNVESGVDDDAMEASVLSEDTPDPSANGPVLTEPPAVAVASAASFAVDDDEEEEEEAFGGFSAGAKGATAAAGFAEDDDEGDDEFGGFADAAHKLEPAAAGVADDDEDDDFGDFGGTSGAGAVGMQDDDDDGFGDFGAGGAGAGGDFDSFGGAATDQPMQPSAATVQDPTSAATLMPSNLFDGSDVQAVKSAAAAVLARALPPPQPTESVDGTTGATGAPTLDQLLAQQVPHTGQDWNTDFWCGSAEPASDVWRWVGSQMEQGVMQSLGVPARDQEGGSAVAGQRASESPPFGAPATPKAPHEPSVPSMGGDVQLFAASQPPPMPVAPPPPPMPTANAVVDSFGGFGGFDGGSNLPPQPQSVPPAATAISDFEGFGDFGAPAVMPTVAPAAPAAPPGAMMDFDLLSGLGSSSAAAPSKPDSSGELLKSTMATLGGSSSIDSFAGTTPNATEAWLVQLPDLAYVLSPSLSRPSSSR